MKSSLLPPDKKIAPPWEIMSPVLCIAYHHKRLSCIEKRCASNIYIVTKVNSKDKSAMWAERATQMVIAHSS